MTTSRSATPKKKWTWLYDLALIGVLLVGAYFRLVGADWGELSNQHPDELFFTSVTYDIQPVHSLGEYFSTARSTLNPYNMGHAFYVYGTLPLILVRYLAVWLGQMDHLKLFGREMSGLVDLGTVALLYFMVKRLYGPRVGLLAAAFSALAVMQIQQAHFYTTDSFLIFFMFLTLYFAVLIATGNWNEAGKQDRPSLSLLLKGFLRDPLVLLCLAFGVALGMAAASKINAIVLAFVLPLALLTLAFKKQTRGVLHFGLEFWVRIFIYLALGAIATVVSFRIFQPYAFVGLGLNPQWLSNLKEIRGQASPNADLPWALQWARRTHLYSFQNLTVWGLGLPLGILAWAGFLWMGWRILKGEWRQHLLVWSWTAGYFLWQSLAWNPTMRYQLPVYSLLAMTAAWLVIWLWDKGRQAADSRHWSVVYRLSSILIGGIVLVLTAAWAFAFTRIYTRPETRIAASDWIFQNVLGPINLRLQTADGSIYQQPLPFPYSGSFTHSTPYTMGFTPQVDGTLTQVLLAHIADSSSLSTPRTLSLFLTSALDTPPDQAMASAGLTVNFTPRSDPRGDPASLTLDPAVQLKKGVTYFLRLETDGGTLSLAGASFVNETDYDYGLPFRTGNYDPFGGLYRGDLNLQVYWDDNPDKLARFLTTLNQGDYIFIPTNHQYGQIPRIPERYPLTTVYYRELLGCPAEKDILWCYRVAEPGMFHGTLGFDLVKVFTSYPNLGSLQINDQFAEEAFTFYDHPKVMIFQKRPDYDPAKVAAILGAVDTSRAVHLTPGQANTYKDLMLPPDRLAVQQAGGTWSALFSYEALQNKYPALGLVLWYLVIFAAGLFAYPLVRAALPGLADGGYPLARIVGLLLWAWFAWVAGSLGISYSRVTIGVAFGLTAVLGAVLAYRQRLELKQEWRGRWKYFLLIEGLFLAFFLLDLAIRLGNPDLWHPSKGGERPMDFAYLNAILKSTTFPPYDPWFAGGYINYYYYGYVIVGTPVKLLGIVPAIAYNLILPTLFAMLAMAGFSVGWNLLSHRLKVAGDGRLSSIIRLPSFFGGLTASAAMVLLGNLGTVHMLVDGFQTIAAPGGVIDKGNFFQHIYWTVLGFFLSLSGAHLPYGYGNWYWDPSRIFPPGYSDFFEYPIFTFIYSDLHAHMIAYMLTVLAIAWTLSVLLAKARWKSHTNTVLGFLLGGLIIGSLKPTNTWDFYTYFVLAAVALTYAVWRYSNPQSLRLKLPGWAKRLLLVGGALAALAALSMLLYQPFSHWFGQAYTSIQTWTGPRTPISVYLTQWGVFLFFIVSWMVWETRQWLAATPVSALYKLKPYQELIFLGVIVFALILVLQQLWVMSSSQNVPWGGVTILWLALPLAVWAAILIFRPGMSDLKRLVLFMIGTGLLLTMVVELLVVTGDIGRFNTVFKFGVQSWILLGISAAAAFTWLLTEIRAWLPGWRIAWQITSIILVVGAGLFLLLGGLDKIRDRMAVVAPHTLDSMTYMKYAGYSEFGVDMDLSQDYRAIRWMQDNVQGSPVIVEASSSGIQYTWLARFSIYTGLPDVVGWEWHQMQQRVLEQGIVKERGVEVDDFYKTADPEAARDFLRRYNARYIIVGQLERAKYTPGSPGSPDLPVDAPSGLLKFEQWNGTLWTEVYRDGQTVIYRVLP